MARAAGTTTSTGRQVLGRCRRGGELRPLVCLAGSLASALFLTGLGVGGGWLAGMFRGSIPGSPMAGDVRAADIVTGLWIAGAGWLVALVWLWRPAVRLHRHSLPAAGPRQWPGPLAACGAVLAAVTVLSYVVGRRAWDEREYLITGLSLLGAGAIVALWLPAVFRLQQGRPVAGPGGRINVHCPECGYSMAGLRESTCPECGRRYTIDQLIGEQGYAKAGTSSTATSPPQ